MSVKEKWQSLVRCQVSSASVGLLTPLTLPDWMSMSRAEEKTVWALFSLSAVCAKEALWEDFKVEHKSCWVFFFFSFYLCIPLIVAAVVVSAALFLVGDLRLGGAVVFRWGHRVGSLGHLHRFSVNCVGHSHCKVLLGDAGKYREPERDGGVHEGCFLLTNYKTAPQMIKRSWEAAQDQDAFYFVYPSLEQQEHTNQLKTKYWNIYFFIGCAASGQLNGIYAFFYSLFQT